MSDKVEMPCLRVEKPHLCYGLWFSIVYQEIPVRITFCTLLFPAYLVIPNSTVSKVTLTKLSEPGTVAHICNSSCLRSWDRKITRSRGAWAVQGQPGLHTKTKTNNKQNQKKLSQALLWGTQPVFTGMGLNPGGTSSMFLCFWTAMWIETHG